MPPSDRLPDLSHASQGFKRRVLSKTGSLRSAMDQPVALGRSRLRVRSIGLVPSKAMRPVSAQIDLKRGIKAIFEHEVCFLGLKASLVRLIGCGNRRWGARSHG